MSEEIIYWCLRKIDRNSPNLNKISNIVKDSGGYLYSVIFSKKKMITEGEYKQAMEKYFNNGIIVCSFSCKDIVDDKGHKIIEIIAVIDDIKAELKLLRYRAQSTTLKNKFSEKRDASRDACKKELLEKLKNVWVTNALQLCMIPPVHFQETYWKQIVSTIIWRTAGTSKHLTKEDLFDLSEALWWDLRNDVKRELHKKAGIDNLQTLLDYWIMRFINTFSNRMLGLFTEYKDRPSEKNLIELGEYLWWKLASSIRKILREKWIPTSIDVLRSPKWSFRGINGYIWRLLWRSIEDISIDERYLLCEKIKRDIPKEISDAIKNSLKKGNSMYEAIKNLWFYDTIRIIYDFLPQISKSLGYNPLQCMRTEFRQQLQENRWVTSNSTYIANISALEIKRLGLLRLWLFFGHSVRTFCNQDKIKLWKILWYAT